MDRLSSAPFRLDAGQAHFRERPLAQVATVVAVVAARATGAILALRGRLSAVPGVTPRSPTYPKWPFVRAESAYVRSGTAGNSGE